MIFERFLYNGLISSEGGRNIFQEGLRPPGWLRTWQKTTVFFQKLFN